MSTADARSIEGAAEYVALHPDALDADQRAVYEEIAGGARSGSPVALRDADGRLHGPFGPMLLSPAVGGPLQALGAAIRFGSSLGDVQREAIILAVAVQRRSDFEWRVHEAVARRSGLGDDVIAAIGAGDDPALPDELAPFVRLGRAVAAGQSAPTAAYAIRQCFGDAVAFEALTTGGYYALLADILSAFPVTLPEGVEPRFTGGDAMRAPTTDDAGATGV